jgi:hypothetical protein
MVTEKAVDSKIFDDEKQNPKGFSSVQQHYLRGNS